MGNCQRYEKYQASRCFPMKNSKSMQDVMSDSKRVLVVMDGLKEFSIDLLEWVLKNVTFIDGCTLTLLGIIPWTNIPLSSKTWLCIWDTDFGGLSSFLQEKNGFKDEPEYHKIQSVFDLCQQYGVLPDIVTVKGHPLRLVVVDQICSLDPTLVAFDKHHQRKYIDYYAENVSCDMVVMNDNGEVDLIKKQKPDSSEETAAADYENMPKTREKIAQKVEQEDLISNWGFCVSKVFGYIVAFWGLESCFGCITQ